jgi:prepilin-type N-terminal cleavage/methylation domain-containing protein
MPAGRYPATPPSKGVRVRNASLSPRRARRSERGLTLVEVLVGLALFGFVLVAITPLFMASIKFNVTANEATSIHILARDRLEQLMSLTFSDAQLTPGGHGNDLPAVLPDPGSGRPPSGEGVRNPFRVCYQVFQFRIPDAATVGEGASFTARLVTAPGEAYHYKRIDVTVTSDTGTLGMGVRKARVSGLVSNPAPESNFSTADPGGGCD